MAKLNCGFNFTEEHFKVLMSLISTQQDKPSKITSIYGSPGRLNELGSVRENYRESTPHFDDMEEWLSEVHRYGVEVNLTFNNLVPGMQSIDALADDILALVEDFKPYFDNWIVAHPGIIDLLLHRSPEIKIIVSTIMNVHTLPQLVWIKENWPNVIRVCPAIEKNRDYEWLKKANAIIPLELLANEFCCMGGADCEGLYRQICYMTQSLNFGGWKARFKCMKQRIDNPVSWLQSRFILPQWIKYYVEVTEIDNFKITGRTHGPEFLKYIASVYMNEFAEGNLLQLWGQLESTLKDVDQKEVQKNREKEQYIPIFILGEKPLYCQSDYCGTSCKHCQVIWKDYNDAGKRNARPSK